MSLPIVGVRFLVGWLIGILFLALVPGVQRFAIDATTATSHHALDLLRVPHVVSGQTLRLEGTGVAIVSDCTPTQPVLLLAAALIAFPATWSSRLLGWIAGSLFLGGVNLVRVLALLAVAVRWPAHFDAIHTMVWQTATFLALSATFLVWVRTLHHGRAT